MLPGGGGGGIKAPTSENNIPSDVCAQRRFRSACAYAQADQNLRWALFWIAKDAKFVLYADIKDADQTARMHRLT